MEPSHAAAGWDCAPTAAEIAIVDASRPVPSAAIRPPRTSWAVAGAPSVHATRNASPFDATAGWSCQASAWPTVVSGAWNAPAGVSRSVAMVGTKWVGAVVPVPAQATRYDEPFQAIAGFHASALGASVPVCVTVPLDVSSAVSSDVLTGLADWSGSAGQAETPAHRVQTTA